MSKACLKFRIRETRRRYAAPKSNAFALYGKTCFGARCHLNFERKLMNKKNHHSTYHLGKTYNFMMLYKPGLNKKPKDSH
jgi:hypothetical protein